MNTLLQDLYRGRICLGESTINDEQKRKLDVIIAYQNAVLSALDEKGRESCRKLWEDMTAVSAEECEMAYIRGMRMGAKLALALLGERGA